MNERPLLSSKLATNLRILFYKEVLFLFFVIAILS